jgi:hypothetical protein
VKASATIILLFPVFFASAFLLLTLLFIAFSRGGIHSDWWYPLDACLALVASAGYSVRVYRALREGQKRK